jgi:hypothetical protein
MMKRIGPKDQPGMQLTFKITVNLAQTVVCGSDDMVNVEVGVQPAQQLQVEPEC